MLFAKEVMGGEHRPLEFGIICIAARYNSLSRDVKATVGIVNRERLMGWAIVENILPRTVVKDAEKGYYAEEN